MTLEDGTELSPALGHRRVRREDPGRTPASAPRSTRQAPATAAGLLGCGVMAGLGAAINTGNVGRGDSVAVIGCGGVGAAAIAGARLAGASHDHRASTSTTASSTRPSELGATAHGQRQGRRRRRGDPGAHRRVRRRCRDRRGRPARDLEAGVLRPRPGRHRRPRRRPDAGDARSSSRCSTSSAAAGR